MRVYIKEWPNKTATIMTENGQVVWTFNSTDQAQQACQEWLNIHAEDIDFHSNVNDDPSAASCLV